jgi:hypothetical protein
MLKSGTAATRDRQIASFTTGKPAVTTIIPAARSPRPTSPGPQSPATPPTARRPASTRRSADTPPWSPPSTACSGGCSRLDAGGRPDPAVLVRGAHLARYAHDFRVVRRLIESVPGEHLDAVGALLLGEAGGAAGAGEGHRPGWAGGGRGAGAGAGASGRPARRGPAAATARAALASEHITCDPLTVSPDTAAFRPGGQARVQAICTVSLAGPGVAAPARRPDPHRPVHLANRQLPRKMTYAQQF